MRIAYFVHDLSDPAVERRVRMLLTGGAEVVLLGFRRTPEAVASVAGVPSVDLGRTYDARLAQRAALAAWRALGVRAHRRALGGCDVVMARNLEMLAVAARARDLGAPKAALVYECLDIHRMMLARGPAGGALRALERALLARSSRLVVSSPAFLEAYFRPVQGLSTPSLLVENKVFDPAAAVGGAATARAPGPPWKIGWFGMIRCRRSLALLAELVRRNPGLVEVVIRGRPSLDQFDDFEAEVARVPGVGFGGPYRPDDLGRLYGEVHFTWAIDWFDAGRNSDWLLPNRVYEGALHGSVALALAHVEAGRWVAARGAGLTLADPLPELATLFSGLTAERYAGLAAQVQAIPRSAVVADAAQCAAFVRTLAEPAS